MSTALQAGVACTAIVGLTAGAAWYASAWPGSQIFGRVLTAGGDPSEIALTFDDGPNDVATPHLLDLLALHGVRATFFVMGSYVQRYPELTRRTIAEGHLLGNHTMLHPRLSIQPAKRIRQELADCNAVIEGATGAAVSYFRPPFGARRPFVLRAARELGLTPVLWNVSGYDWKPIGAAGILGNLTRGIARNRRWNRGSNLLLHDGGHNAAGEPRMDTVRAVERLLSARNDSDRYVTVDAFAAEVRCS